MSGRCSGRIRWIGVGFMIPGAMRLLISSVIEALIASFRSSIDRSFVRLAEYASVIFIATLKYLNMLPNSVHPTLTPSIIFQGYKLDITTQAPILSGSLSPFIIAKRVISKYEPHTVNGIVLYLADNVTSNVVAWIPGRNTVATINKYTIIKASPSDLGLQDTTIIIVSHIPDFLTLSRCPQEGDTIQAHPIQARHLYDIVSSAAVSLHVKI